MTTNGTDKSSPSEVIGFCWDARLTETLLRLIRSGELKASGESAFSFLAEVDPDAPP